MLGLQTRASHVKPGCLRCRLQDRGSGRVPDAAAAGSSVDELAASTWLLPAGACQIPDALRYGRAPDPDPAHGAAAGAGLLPQGAPARLRALIRRTAQSVPGPARARDALEMSVCGTSTSGRPVQSREGSRRLGRGGLSDHREGSRPQQHAAESARLSENNRQLACRAVVRPGRQLGFRGGLGGFRRRTLGRALAGRGTCARGMRRAGRSTSAPARAGGRA